MTATEEQCRLLYELRKLACDINEKEIRSHSVITLNHGRHNRQFRLDMNHEWLNAWHAEFERILQAIEATLGPRTCKDLGGGPDEFGEWYFVCSECKCEFGYDNFACEFADGYDIGSPHYCPNCGAKVASE